MTGSIATGITTDRLLLVSTDSHAGLPTDQYVIFLDPQYRGFIDDLTRDHREFYKLLEYIHPFSTETLELIDDRGVIRSGGETGQYDAARRLREAEAEGVVAEVIHPAGDTVFYPFFGSTNEACSKELRAAGARAYNRWLAEFCRAAPDRLIGLAQIEPWPDMKAAVREIERVRESGLGGVMPPMFAGCEPDQPHLHDPFWDPFWAACADQDLPVSIHAGQSMGPQGELRQLFRLMRDALAGVSHNPDGGSGMVEFDEASTKKMEKAMTQALGQAWAGRRVLWQLMWGGVLDRFPKLKVVFAEIRADWVPGTLAYLDRRHAEGGTPLLMKPSEYWERNFAVAASSIRPTEIGLRHEIGLKTLTFGTDFPHVEGTWPNTVAWLRATFAGVPEDEARLILGENAVTFYGLDRALLAKEAARVGPAVEDILGEGPEIDPRVIAHFNQRSGYLKGVDTIDDAQLAALVSEDESSLTTAW